MKKALAIAAFAALPVLSFAVAPTYSKSSNPVAAKKPANKPPSDDDFAAVKDAREELMTHLCWMHVEASLMIKDKKTRDLGFKKLGNALEIADIVNRNPVTPKQARGYVEAMKAASAKAKKHSAAAMESVCLKNTPSQIDAETAAKLKEEREFLFTSSAVVRAYNLVASSRKESDKFETMQRNKICDRCNELLRKEPTDNEQAERLMKEFKDLYEDIKPTVLMCFSKLTEAK